MLASAGPGLLLEVAAVLAAILVGLWWLGRRLDPRRAAGPSAIRLGTGHAAHVVEVEGRRLLIGTGPTGAPRLLTELDPPPTPPEPESRPRARRGWDGT
jgi:hypothetical protein